MMLKRTLRIKYSKNGLLRFIGHLDTTRLLTRAIARSSIPELYNRGFSPHMQVSYGPPLPLGVSGDCEYLDLLIDEAEAMHTPNEWKNELQRYMPDGLGIQELQLMDENAPSLAESIDRARYEITIPRDFAPSNEKLARFLQKENIQVEKYSKRGVKTVDIRPDIQCFKILDTGVEKPGLSVCKIIMKIGQSASATPALLLKALLGCDWHRMPGLRIHRSELYSSAGLL